jgi:hypothetical protein
VAAILWPVLPPRSTIDQRATNPRRSPAQNLGFLRPLSQSGAPEPARPSDELGEFLAAKKALIADDDEPIPPDIAPRNPPPQRDADYLPAWWGPIID